MINIHASYFSIANPLQILDRWMHPPRLRKTVTVRQHPLEVEWTQRAQRALDQRDTPLLVEMQLYFSCVVKKRVLFHDSAGSEAIPVNDKMTILFHPVESESCDPVEFAQSFPVKQQFGSAGAMKMRPKHLRVDFRGGKWIGEFGI